MRPPLLGRPTARPSSAHAAVSWDHAALHTPAALRARQALRHHPRVVEALDCWWSTAQNSMRASGRTPDAIVVYEYVIVSKNIYRAMIAKWDEEEATSNALKEWIEDTGPGGTTLSEEAFKDAMFEVTRSGSTSITRPTALRSASLTVLARLSSSLRAWWRVHVFLWMPTARRSVDARHRRDRVLKLFVDALPADR